MTEELISRNVSEGLQQESSKATRSPKVLKMLTYAEAVKRFQELKDAVPEAEHIMFHERPARTQEEIILGRHAMRYEAALEQAEAFAQSHDPFAEEAHRKLAMLLEAQINILGLYFDALETEARAEDEARKHGTHVNVPPELKMSHLLAESNPWIGEECRLESLSKYEVKA